ASSRFRETPHGRERPAAIDGPDITTAALPGGRRCDRRPTVCVPQSTDAEWYYGPASRRTLIPNPYASEAAHARFHHQDVSTLPSEVLWAERTQLEVELARRITLGVRSQILQAWPCVIDEQTWLLMRLERVTAEQHRRGLRVA